MDWLAILILVVTGLFAMGGIVLLIAGILAVKSLWSMPEDMNDNDF